VAGGRILYWVGMRRRTRPPAQWGLTSFGMLNVSDPICANPPGRDTVAPLPDAGVSGWRLWTQKGSYVATPSRPYLIPGSRSPLEMCISPATCHPPPETLYLPILDTLVCHLCTGPRPVCTFALTLSGPRVLRPSCPRCMPRAHVSPCPHAHSDRCLTLYSILHTRYSRSEATPALQNGVSSTNPTRIFPFGSFVK
jgi:hypothetical protein